MASVITPNSTMGPIRKPTVAPECRFWIPGRQAVGSGVPLDMSGNGYNAILQTSLSDASAWASAGAVSTVAAVAGTARGFSVPAAAWNWEYGNGDTCLIAFQVKRSAGLPATGGRMFGDSPSGTLAGIAFGIDTAGKIQPRVSDSVGHSYLAAASNAIVVATTSWHTCVFMVDPLLKQHRLYIDAPGNFVTTAVPSLSGSTNGFSVGGQLLSFGNSDNTGVAGATTDMQFRNLHGYVWQASNGPRNWNQLVAAIMANPFLPLGGVR